MTSFYWFPVDSGNYPKSFLSIFKISFYSVCLLLSQIALKSVVPSFLEALVRLLLNEPEISLEILRASSS